MAKISRRCPAAYLNELAGKRIVLVGPAASITGRKLASWIEDHDLVVRLNLSCPPPSEMRADIGVRTDILYHRLLDNRLSAAIQRVHCPSEIAAWKSNGVRWIVTSQPAVHGRTINFQKINQGAIPLVTLDKDSLPSIKKMSGSKSPSMGTIAICHLLSSDLACLDVTGIDFYRSAYFVGYGGFTAEQAARGTGRALWGQREDVRRRSVPHPQLNQMNFMRSLVETEPRLVFDDVAMAAMER